MLLNVKHIEARYAVFANITTTSFHVHITTCAKSGVAGACQYDYIDICSFSADVERIAHLGCCCWSEGVAITLSVDRDTCDTIIEIK